MGLFATGLTSKTKTPSLDLLTKHECRLCDLNTKPLYSPKMQATGAENPVIYMLGEAPGLNEDKEGKQFVGQAGQLLRPLIPNKWQRSIRWNNSIRCWPGQGNPNPSDQQLACCRPSIIRDIEACRPKAIFSFGNVPLQWLLGQTGIMTWRGRYAPVKVGSHICWAFFFLHPAFIKRKGQNGLSEEERVFRFDLERAFNTIKSLPNPDIHTRDRAKSGTILCTGSSPKDFKITTDFLDAASCEELAGVDYETFPIRPYDNGKILSAAVSTGDETLAFGWHHPQARWTPEQLRQLEQAWIKFLRSKVRKAVHFLGFELEWSAYLWGWDIIRASRWEDTGSQAFVLDERAGGSLTLEFLGLQHFGINIKDMAGLNRKDLRNEPIEDVLRYNAIDAKYHKNLYCNQQIRIDDLGLGSQYEDMLRRVATCVLTQLKGIHTNPSETGRLHEQYERQITETLREISDTTEAQSFQRKYRKPYDPAKTEQVKLLCEGILKINIHSDKDDKDHTDKDVLSQLNFPITNSTIKYREIVKLKSTYVDTVTKHVGSSNIIHHNINTVFARTSRSTADDLNMQNWPKRTEVGKEVRKQIVAPPGHVIVAADSAQIQVRNIAMESKDPVLCRMLWENYDMHSDWSERISRVYPDVVGGRKNFTDKKIMKDFRDTCKSGWTFGLFFGCSAQTCSDYLKVPKHLLDPLYEEFWSTEFFSGVHDWQQKLIKQYEEVGYVENLTGIRRRAPISKNQLINAPIQADEAAIIFDSFNRLSEMNDPNLQPIMEIHDDLTFILPENKLEDYCEIVIDEMLRCNFDWINVPLGCEVSKGYNWFEMKEIGKYFSHEWHSTPTRPNYAY